MNIFRWYRRRRESACRMQRLPVSSLEMLEPRVLLNADLGVLAPGTVMDAQPYEQVIHASLVPGEADAVLPDLPGLHLVDPEPANLAGQVIYLDFDGARDVTYNGPAAIGPFDVPAFSLEGTTWAGKEQLVIAEVVSRLGRIFAGSGVGFTVQEPDAVQGCSVILVGGDDSAFREYGSFLGLAEKVDLQNRDRWDRGLVFAGTIVQPDGPMEAYSAALAGVIAHEVGHLLGYKHVMESGAGLLSGVAYHQGDGISGFGNSFVHQYLTKEAYDFYVSQFGECELSDFLGPVSDADYGNRYVVEGSCDEDRPNFVAGEPYDSPWGNTDAHYWAHDAGFNRVFNDGYKSQDSTVNRAYKYFTGGVGLTGTYDAGWGKYAVKDQGIAYKYENSAKETAYYWLGHVAHLLQDTTLPAHTHADPHGMDDLGNPYDEYETYTASSSDWTADRPGAEANWEQWAFPAEIANQESPVGEIRSPSEIPQAPGAIVVPLYGLFYETASLADNYDSDDANGQIDLGTRRAGGISATECKAIGDAMMTWAIKAVAELYRFFYSVVDSQSPPEVALLDLSSDQNNPSQRGSVFDVTASAADPVSGVDADGYHFVTWRWNGASWEGETDWGACAGTDSIGPLVDGLYRIEARVANGAGETGSSSYRYFYVDDVPPAGDSGVTITSCTVGTTGAAPGRAVSLSGTAGQARGADDSDVVKVVVGLRDSSGNWKGSEPLVVASMAPGASWQAWSAGSARLYAPSETGTYLVWVQAVPTLSDAIAIQAFQNATATDGDSQHAQWGESVEVDAGTLCPVYRFWSPVHSHHFYTMDEAERDKLIDHYSHVWTYEGVAFHAYANAGQPGVAPVYRFWSGALNSHFYTMDQAERDKLINEYSGVWTYEGTAYYSYSAASHPVGSRAVYRFWSGTLNGHFYTMDDDEKDNLLTNYSHVWTYEGLAWYVGIA